jgi:hypothetical protein
MAIFTALGVAAALGIAAEGFAAGAIAFGLNAAVSLAASIGLSYAVRALSGQPKQSTDSFGVQGKLAGGGDVPRSFGLGYHTTAGSLVYANTWGSGYDTPNAFLTQVIAVSDLPGEKLVGLWVNGARVTLALGDALYSNFGDGSLGYPVPEYVRPHNGEGSPTPHLWVKFYDGTQTVADGAVQNASSTERPYGASHVGKGICYAVVHAFNDENLWSGFPALKFELSGLPLYDPSKDSTVGGSGAQRYSDRTTWGGDGDNFPAVQIYNLLRGFSYGSAWLYGLQNTNAARLPVANWITQIEKCRATVIGASGAEPTYRTGGQIDVSAQPANAIEAILTGCQGRLSEIGGFYKIHLGAPDTPTFTFSDDDILSSEPQTYRPFFALADSVNGIQATYPDPAQGWNNATAPAYYRTDLEARDGNRRLMASPSFDFVPYPEQAQRLQKSAIEEAQRARTHSLTLPPAFWIVEPGDVGQWTSARNGYSAKQFRVDAAVDRANLDVGLSLTEVDPSDYDWNTGTDFTPVTGGGTISNPPAPQAIDSFDAQPYTLVDSGGIARRPAILISWARAAGHRGRAVRGAAGLGRLQRHPRPLRSPDRRQSDHHAIDPAGGRLPGPRPVRAVDAARHAVVGLDRRDDAGCPVFAGGVRRRADRAGHDHRHGPAGSGQRCADAYCLGRLRHRCARTARQAGTTVAAFGAMARCTGADRRRQDRRRDRGGRICLVLDGRNCNLRLDYRLCQPDRNRDRDL